MRARMHADTKAHSGQPTTPPRGATACVPPPHTRDVFFILLPGGNGPASRPLWRQSGPGSRRRGWRSPNTPTSFVRQPLRQWAGGPRVRPQTRKQVRPLSPEGQPKRPQELLQERRALAVQLARPQQRAPVQRPRGSRAPRPCASRRPFSRRPQCLFRPSGCRGFSAQQTRHQMPPQLQSALGTASMTSREFSNSPVLHCQRSLLI